MRQRHFTRMDVDLEKLVPASAATVAPAGALAPASLAQGGVANGNRISGSSGEVMQLRGLELLRVAEHSLDFLVKRPSQLDPTLEHRAFLLLDHGDNIFLVVRPEPFRNFLSERTPTLMPAPRLNNGPGNAKLFPDLRITHAGGEIEMQRQVLHLNRVKNAGITARMSFRRCHARQDTRTRQRKASRNAPRQVSTRSGDNLHAEIGD